VTSPSPEDERGPRRVYANDEIEVHWEPKLCIHTQNCVRRLGQVFDSTKRPWVDVDAVDPDSIAETVLTCPTGALHFRRLDGGPQEEAPPDTDPRRHAACALPLRRVRQQALLRREPPPDRLHDSGGRRAA
jgi:uncharacterized Fe-S cluster protein YjdI